MKLGEKIGERLGYLRFRDNWHKHPWLSPLLCAIGRHDFETEEVGVDETGTYAILRCFYCPMGRKSWMPKER